MTGGSMNSKIRVIKTDVVKGDFLKEESALKFKKDATFRTLSSWMSSMSMTR
jgi:hypothetical protein